MTSEPTPTRVLYVINGLGTGGAERSLAELLSPLRRRGVEIVVNCIEHRSEGVEEEVTHSNQVDFVGPGLLRSWRGIRRHVREWNPDIVHTTLFESDVLGRLASIATEVSVVTSIVNTSYETPEGGNPDVPGPKLRVVQAIDGFTARHFVDRFHALTVASAQAAARALGISAHQIAVIPRARDTTRLGTRSAERRQRVRADLGLAGDRYVMLSVGRREHQKGQEHAIAATALIARHHPGALLLVAGRDGAAGRRLEDAVTTNGVADRVRFLGHRTDVPDLMVAADVLLFPSLYEGFGGTLIEAMALGLPIVASDIPTLREVAADTAMLVPPGSSSALAEAVIRLIDDPASAGVLTSQAQRRFAENYTIDVVADQMAAFYRSTALGSGENGSSDL